MDTKLWLWKLTRTSPDYEEETVAVVVAEDEAHARLAAVEHFPDSRVAAEFASRKASTILLIGTALTDAENGSLVFSA